MLKLSITCADFKPIHRNTLVGFATIHIGDMRLTIKDVAIHTKGESRWAALPAKPQIDRNGVPIRDANGKIAYATLFEFDSVAVRNAFSHAVIAALLDRFPHAFAMGAAA
jgi:hypothetical protein